MSEIRRACADDLEGVKALLMQVLAVHHEGRPDLFKAIGQKYSDDELLQIFADDNNPVFVMVDNGKVLGHCFCQTVDRKESPAVYAYKTLYIDDLCVDEVERGKHVGKALYDYVKAYAKDNGYYNVTLHAWECNPAAIGFYKHLGLAIQQYTMEEIL